MFHLKTNIVSDVSPSWDIIEIFSETLEETYVRFLGFQEKNISIKSLQCHIAVDFPFAENFLTEVAL